MDQKDLTNRFAYHPPKDEETKQQHELVRQLCLTLALQLNEIVPDGREKAYAMTELELVMWWSNAGVARPKVLSLIRDVFAQEASNTRPPSVSSDYHDMGGSGPSS